MTKQLGKFIADNTIGNNNLTAGARTGVLASKLVALRDAVLGFTTTAASSNVVTTEVLAAATTDTPQTALTALGIYTGAVSAVTDNKRVLIRAAGTDNGISDGTKDDIYGVLTESGGVYTLSYKKQNGTAFTFSGATAIDFFFVEIYALDSMPASALLEQGVGGVLDATNAANIHTEGVETITLSGTDITNKYVDLAQVPYVAANTAVFVKGSGPQVYTDDYTVITNGSDIRRLNWSTLGLDGVLVAADKLVVRYLY